MRRSRSANDHHELNTVPMMNLFVVLVPMLLLSAVFVEIGSIDLATSGEASAEAGDAGPPTVTVTATEIRVQVHPGARIAHRFDRSAEESYGALEEALAGWRADAESPEIIIASAPMVKYQALIHVIDRARAAGFTSYSLASYRETDHAI